MTPPVHPFFLLRTDELGWPRARREMYEQFIRVASPEQLERFEHWKRSKFPRAAMRRLMSEMLGSSTERGAIVPGGPYS